MCVSLPSSNIFFHFNFLLSPSGTPPRELQVLWRPHRLPDLQSSSFPFPHTAITLRAGSHLLFIHRPHSRPGRVRCTDCYTAWYCTRNGSVQEASRISTSSHLQEYSFTQLHSFKEVLLALLLTFKHSWRFY